MFDASFIKSMKVYTQNILYFEGSYILFDKHKKTNGKKVATNLDMYQDH